MKISVLHSLEELSELREEWENLWLQQQYASPYQSWGWIHAWVIATNNMSRLHILVVRRNDGGLIGVAALQCVPVFFRALHVLTPIGQEASISPDFVASPGCEQQVCQAVLEFIGSSWRTVGLVAKLAEPLGGATGLLDLTMLNRYGFGSIMHYSDRQILQLPDCYESFVGSLSGKMRNEMRTASRKLVVNHEVCFAENAESSLEILFNLNDNRWGASGGRKFYENLYPRLFDREMLKIFTLHIDGRPAGALSVLLVGRTAYAELAGFDYEVERRHLGKFFYGLVIDWCIRNGYEYLDLSSGSEEYKLRFNPITYRKYRIEFYGSVLKRIILNVCLKMMRRFSFLRDSALV